MQVIRRLVKMIKTLWTRLAKMIKLLILRPLMMSLILRRKTLIILPPELNNNRNKACADLLVGSS